MLRVCWLYARAIFVLVAGLAAWAITTGMTVEQHLGVAATESGQWLQGGTATFNDAMVVILATVVGALIAMRKFASAGLLSFVLVGFVSYSLLSVTEFGLAQRVGKSQTEQRQEDAANKATADANQLAAGRAEKHLSWLRSEYAKTPRSDRAERARLSAEIAAAVKAPVPIQVAKIEAVGDVSATTITNLVKPVFELSTDGYVTGKVVVAGILLLVGKTLCFALFGWAWSQATQALAARRAAMVVPEVVEPEPTPEVVPEPVPLSAPEASPSTVEPPLPVPMRPFAVVPSVPQLTQRTGKKWRKERAARLTKAFFAEAGAVPGPADQAIKAAVVYGWFREWSMRQGQDALPIVSETAFGMNAGRLGIVRARDQRGSFYYGIGRPVSLKLANAA